MKEVEETNRIVFISYPNDPQQINNCRKTQGSGENADFLSN